MIEVIDNSSGCERIGTKTFMRYSFFNIEEAIVFTFSPAKTAIKGDFINEGQQVWGYDFLAKKRINVISFCCIGDEHWYRDQHLIDFMELLSLKISSFCERLGYGVSMGGFGASSFSNLLKIDRLLLLSPISTLQPKLVSFENRFARRRKSLNWEGNYNDGAVSEAECTIIYDPLYILDRKHVDRFKQAHKIKFSGIGHDVAHQLHKINILRRVFFSFYYKEDISWVSKVIKIHKRQIPKYYLWMLSGENVYLTSKRRAVIETYFDLYKVKYSNYFVMENSKVNLIRDLAIELEKHDILLAYKLMKLAHELKPHGPTINKKLAEYSEDLPLL